MARDGLRRWMLLAALGGAAWTLSCASSKGEPRDGGQPHPVPLASETQGDASAFVTASFERTDVKEAVAFIARTAGKEIGVDEDVQGEVTISFAHASWVTALDSVLSTSNGVLVVEDGGRRLHVVNRAKVGPRHR